MDHFQQKNYWRQKHNRFCQYRQNHFQITVHENENGGEGETNDKDQDSKGTKQKDTLPEPTQEVKSVLVKNKEECDKCTNRIGKGVRCTTCSKTWHWRCVGITKETTKQEVVTANIWHCHKCQGIDLKCIFCKEKDKEIRGLKQSITELEKHLQTVNVALKDSTLEITQIKEKLANEKRIRTILEKDIEEMMSSSSSEDSGPEGGASTDSESKKERKNRGKDQATKPMKVTTRKILSQIINKKMPRTEKNLLQVKKVTLVINIAKQGIRRNKEETKYCRRRKCTSQCNC